MGWGLEGWFCWGFNYFWIGGKGVIYPEVVDDELSSLGFLGQGICTLLLLYSLLAGWRSVDLAILVKRGCRSIHWTRRVGDC